MPRFDPASLRLDARPLGTQPGWCSATGERAGARRLAAGVVWAALGAAALACGADGDGESSGAEPSSSGGLMGGAPPSGAGASSGAGGGASKPETVLAAFAEPGCTAPAGLAPPSSIAQTVEWINALPKPLSLACFLETLERPLGVYASESVFSAQPAAGRRSPRMFLFAEPLIMSITPDGEGSPLLEFGERRSSSSSLKGEIVFPVTGELEPSAPYDHLIVDERFTSCGGCHGDEVQDPAIPFARAFISRAIRPAPAERVGLEELHLEARTCDALAEPDRCAMLVAVFGQGNVTNAEFPATLGTFY